MATKLTAARIATAAGVTMVILNSNQPERIPEVLKGVEKIGTKFYPIQNAPKGRKRWILNVPVRGRQEQGTRSQSKAPPPPARLGGGCGVRFPGNS
eukprot:208329-Chlamydomonas_euryale.AAC.1